MTGDQWKKLLSVVKNRDNAEMAVALIIDSPWLPSFSGITTKEYLFLQEKWLTANINAMMGFPDVIFLPGTWVEFGLATEPSAFGCHVRWWKDNPPSALPVLNDISEIARLSVPNPETDGMMPIVLEWQSYMEPRLHEYGHVSKVVVARGPLTLASQIMGLTEFLLAIKTDPEACIDLLNICTESIISWLQAQSSVLPNVEAVQVHDDVIGMISPVDYEEFAHPYLSRIFDQFPDWLHIYHNDTPGIKFLKRFADAGVHVFNFSHMIDIAKVDELIGNSVCLMGNVPPLEVLAKGSVSDVITCARECIERTNHGFLLSAGGGVSPGTPAENINALVRVANGSGRYISDMAINLQEK